MPRIRNIKPDAFTDAELGELPPVARWFYAGLWTHADCEGILEDKPRELKMKIIPYDKESGEEMLDLLEDHQRVVRYEAAGKRLIWIPKLKEHQKFHKDEKPKGYPLPPNPEQHLFSTLPIPHRHPASTLPAPCQHPADPVPAPCQQGASRPETETETITETETGRETEESEEPWLADASAPPPTPPEALQGLWNKRADPSLPRWVEMPPKRRQRAKAALKGRSLLSWLAVIERINQSHFCRGAKGWAATPDWLIQPGVAAKVLEGHYDDRRGPSPPHDIRKGTTRAEDQDHDTNKADANGNIPF